MDVSSTELIGATERATRFRRWLAVAVTVVYAVLLALALRHHEMWRDEIQAWLLARDTPRWWGLPHAIRYEGHPGLWHMLLWPVARLSWNPVWMQVVHAAVGSAAVWTFVRFAPFAWPVRVLLPFGYVLFYEWGVISRNYALSALLMFLFCAAFSQRWRRFPWAAAALAAACHTNVHALLLVLTLTPLLLIDYAVAVAGRWREAHIVRGRVALSFLLLLFGVATAMRQIQPPEDTGFATAWYWHWDTERAANAAFTLLRAHAPVPDTQKTQFWNTCRPLERWIGDRDATDSVTRMQAAARDTLWIAVVIAGVVLARRPWLLVHWLAGTSALGLFFYVKFMGSTRHHAFHWLWMVVVLWLALDHAPWQTGRERIDRLLARLEGLLLHGLLLASATVQLWGAIVAVRLDRQQVFSNAKAAAAWLRSEGLLDDVACFAGQGGPTTSAVVGHAQLPRIYFTGRNEWGSYVIWDQDCARHLQGRRLAEELRDLRDREGKDLVFLSSLPIPEWQLPNGMQQVASFDAAGAMDSVWIYRWPLPPANLP